MYGTLKIMSWNANGLQSRQNELQVALDINNIDLCLLSETHLTAQSYITFKGYRTYHTTHPDNKARGGSAILVKESIHHHEEPKFEERDIQATAITVSTKKGRIRIVSVYSPPRHNIKSERYKEFFAEMGNRFIIGGDYNAKHTHWGSRLTTTKGRELLRAAQDVGCDIVSTGKPTYWPTDPSKMPDLIDFFIMRNISSNYVQIDDNLELSSDHTPILLTLSEHVITKPSRPCLVNKKTDWESFALALENRIELAVPLKNTEQLDSEAKKLVDDIQGAAWLSTPEIRTRLKGNNYPKEILQLIAEKRKARKKWQRTRNPRDKTVVNKLTSDLRTEIKEIKNATMSHFLRSLTSDSKTDYSLWKTTKNLKRPIMQTPPIKNADGTWARNDDQKAERFAEHLEKTFQPNEGCDLYPLPEIVEQEGKDITFVTPTEVKREIQLLSSKKTPGFDLITGEVLKRLPRKAVVKVTNLVNASFRLQHVPQSWKVAEVIMIPKPGKPPHEVSSYRPISLLPIMSKLLEKLLLKRLKPIIEERQLIPNHQFGFRDQHSTIEQVHRIVNIIEKTIEEKKVCSTIFLDVAQAFDRVWHEGLTRKLKSLLPIQYVNFIESYITQRYFRIKQEDAYSSLKKIEAGVPQGSVLGPILYLLYTCDLPTQEDSLVATFADDTAILAVGDDNIESTTKLQKAITDIHRWTKKWRIKLNESKSVHVEFTNKRCEHKSVFINDVKVPYENTAKYLGMTLDAKLRWKPHVKRKTEELQMRYRKMYWLLGQKSVLSTYNKLMLYRQVLRPIWTYGIQLWGCASQSNRDIVQRFQSKVLRGIASAPWFVRNDNLHKDLDVETVDRTIQKFAQSHHDRLQTHVNEEAV